MEQRCVFVTGAGSGIGRAAAELFGERGWYVGLFDINEEAVHEVAQGIGETTSCSGFIDVCDPASIQTALDSFSERTGGRLDVLVNNAGLLSVAPFDTIPLERHALIVDVNTKGVLNCAYLAFPLLKQTPGARVVNMASASSLTGIPDFASYSATKFFVRGFTEALNLEWKQHDIHVSEVSPSFVKTPMLDGAASQLIEKLGVDLSPEQIATEIWHSATGKGVHRIVGIRTQLLDLFLRLAPYSMRRAVMSNLSGYP